MADPDNRWTDAIVGERMAVDREFSDRIADSRFSSQEWGLIMTATEFEIENADDPETARMVADTSNLPQIVPELENVRGQMAAMGGGASGGSGTASGSSDGLFASIKSALGLDGGGSGGVDQAELEAAENLVQEYADRLQQELEAADRWEQVRIAYQE